MGFGDFYKGDKKKKRKKSEQQKNINFTPVFIPPKIIPKGKKDY